MSDFLKQLFSDSPGVSFGRVGSFIALLAGIYWVTVIVLHTSTLPDLSGLTFFIGSLYVLGKGVGTVRAIFGKEGAVSSQPANSDSLQKP
jgi:hypothetical protein